MNARLNFASLAGLAVLATSAQAQPWTATVLTPPGAFGSNGLAVSGAQCGGYVVTDKVRAAIWSGSTTSWVDLTPSIPSVNVSASRVAGVGGGQQVGSYDILNVIGSRAALWTGTAASFVDLHPSGARLSEARATSGTQQVGMAAYGTTSHAILWNGSATSFIDLNPPGFSESIAAGISGGQQVGYAYLGSITHAGLWTGTAASFVDLHPAVASRSLASATSGTQQVGNVMIGNASHAALWSGTAASFIDLNPPGSALSAALAVAGGMQVGQAYIGGVGRAVLWSGTPGSVLDLHQFLPPSTRSSNASGIWIDASGITVIGELFDANQNHHAVLWHYASVPVCPADFNGDGFADGFDYDDFVACFEGQTDGPGCPNAESADFNHDGFVDGFDYDDYLGAFEEGC